jgi:asparagine synthase (glutamine-hydrolysing)
LSPVPRPLLAGAARGALWLRSRGARIGPQTRWGKLGDALGARGSLVALYQSAYGLFAGDFLRRLMPGVAHGIGLSGQRTAELAAAAAGRSDLAAISALELASFLGDRLLRDTDAASMDVSLEARVPLLDHRVIEAAFALDDTVRFQRLGRKEPLRRIGLAGLDPALFERPKSGFVLPIERWCRAGLGDQITAAFADRRACSAVGLDGEVVQQLWQAFQSGAPGIYWSRVWSLYVLLRWSAANQVSL